MIIDTRKSALFLTLDRVRKTRELAAMVVGYMLSWLMFLEKLLGLLVANMEAVQWGRLHSRDLQLFLKPYQPQIMEKTDMVLQVLLEVRNSLLWWMVSSNLSRGKLYHIVEEEHLMDPSLSGWGAVWKDSPVQGTWLQKEGKSSVNLLELRAIWLAMLYFADSLKDKHVLLWMDNVAAKAHIIKQGGSKSSALHKKARRLFLWAEHQLWSVRAEHIRGLDNIQADWLS